MEEENLAAHASVQSLMDKLYVIPSKVKVSPGDSWDKDLEYLTRMDESTSGEVHTTFLGWRQENGARYARFESNLKIEMARTQNNAEQNTTITGAGMWRFDPSEGKIVKSSLDYTMELEMYMDIPPEKDPEGEGASINLSATGEGKVTLTQSTY